MINIGPPERRKTQSEQCHYVNREMGIQRLHPRLLIIRLSVGGVQYDIVIVWEPGVLD